MKYVDDSQSIKVGRMRFLSLSILVIMMTLGAKVHAALIYYVDVTHSVTGYALNYVEYFGSYEVVVAPGPGAPTRFVYPLDSDIGKFYIEMQVGNQWYRVQDNGAGYFNLTTSRSSPEYQSFEAHLLTNTPNLSDFGLYIRDAYTPGNGTYCKPYDNGNGDLTVSYSYGGSEDPVTDPSARFIIRSLRVVPPW